MDARPPGIPDATWADYVAVLEPLRRLWPSREQWEIIKALRDGSHVLVNSVAGSGKTTTACFIAALNRERRCLLLTYNARLKEETRARRDDWRLGNLEVHSFHAAGVKYFSDRCRVDEGLVDVVHDAAAARLERPVAPFDVIIIDETQDVTPLLFAFLHHMCGLVVEARGPAKDPIQLVCVGDERQAIFGFRNADARFLRHADRLMPSFACRPWARCTLSTSYRVTPPMAAFINEAMLGGAGSIVSSKPPGRYQPVVYVTGNPWVISASLASYVAQQVHMGFQKPGDFIIETPSLKGFKMGNNTPLQRFANELSRWSVGVQIPSSGDFVISDKVANNKVLISTYHQAKGLERRTAIVLQFCASYFKFYAKDKDPKKCTEPQYVAASRAKQELILVAEEKPGDHLPFLDLERFRALEAAGLVRVVKKDGAPSSQKDGDDEAQKAKPYRIEVTALTDFLDEPVIRAARSTLDEQLYCEPYTSIALAGTAPGVVEAPSAEVLANLASAAGESGVAAAAAAAPSLPVLASTSTVEEVRDLNGLAIPAMIEAVMRAAAAKSAFLPSRPPPWPPALPAEFLQETPEIAPPQARPTRVSNELTDGVLDLTCGDEPDAVPPPPPAALNLFAASPSQRLLGEVPCAGKRVRGGGAPPVSPPRSAALAALRKRGGLCTMLDVLDQHIPPRQPGGKRGRRDETDEDGEFRHSLAEIHAEYRRATTDPALTWDPSGGGVAAGAPRIPRPAIFLRIASLCSALQSGFISKHCQLRAFDWMPEAAAAACIAVARTLISDLDEGAFEVPVACAAYEWSNEEQRLRPRAAEFAEQQSPKRARRLASGAAASPGVGGAARAVEGAPPLAAPPPHAAPQQPAAAAPEAGAGAAVAASPPSDDPAAAADAEGCRPVTVEGILDLVTPTAVWELKCVDALRGEHFLQLAIYAWLWEAGGSRLLRGPRDFRLANLLTGEAWEVAADFRTLTALVSALVTKRLGACDAGASDADFLYSCARLAEARPAPELLDASRGVMGHFRPLGAPPPAAAAGARPPLV